MIDVNNPTNPEELANFLRSIQQPEKQDLGSLRYGIYLRKSTEDPEKQVRSIEDQEAECLKVANDHNIVVLKENIIKEEKSAKESGIRPLFRKLLDRVIDGELDGIIAWHPNRLTRNMGEAGEIIDLLDKNIIKDLKFASHTFVNDPSGKMLLGIVFVMAKQYSEQLSSDVHRGNKKSTEAGAYINKAKHGYYKDSNQFLRPDGNNFALMQEAFQMRLQKKTLQSIADFLNHSSYSRKNSQNSKPIKTKFYKQSLSKVFADPIYAGVNKYGKNIVTLKNIYDFIPMISVEEYIKINKFNPHEKVFKGKQMKRSKYKREASFLNGQVFCNHCKGSMSAGISKGSKGGSYYYFRCMTKDCERYNKSTRGKVIFDYVINYLAKKPFSSLEAYQSYKAEILRKQKEDTQTVTDQINNTKRNLGKIQSEMKLLKSKIVKETDSEMIDIQREELSITKDREKHLKQAIQELLEKKDNLTKSPQAFEQFMQVIDGLSETLPKVQKNAQKGSIISKIFLNFYVSQKSVEKYTLKAPFGALERVNDSKVNDGGR